MKVTATLKYDFCYLNCKALSKSSLPSIEKKLKIDPILDVFKRVGFARKNAAKHIIMTTSTQIKTTSDGTTFV